jgi:catechol 2,3-dioxygenase-like lactoylglutathione lyase family enzyme
VQIHHTVIRVRDMDRSIRFWHEGVGLELMMDGEYEGDWPTLFNAPTHTLRSVFLGEAGQDGGILELVDFGVPGRRHVQGDRPDEGLMLIAFQCPIEPVLERMAALGFEGPRRQVTVPSRRGPVRIVLLEDPDGVYFELTEFI